MRQGLLFSVLFFGEILASGCRPDGEKLRGLTAGFSKEFFRTFPDSAAVAGQAVAPGDLLAAPGPAVLVEKKAFLEKERAGLQAIRAEKLDAGELRALQFLLKKTESLLARLDGDLSLFDALPALRSVCGNKPEQTADRHADLAVLLKKLPAYYAAAKSNFTKKKGENGGKAIADGIETFRFLATLEKDFPQNGDLDRAVLAVKDWVAFCRSSAKY